MGLSEKVLDLDSPVCMGEGRQVAGSARACLGLDPGLSVLETGLRFRSEEAAIFFLSGNLIPQPA